MQNERTKMCPSCHGNAPLHVDICPYCANSFFEKNETISNENISQDNSSTLSYEETLTSLYPPPYKPKVIPTSTNNNISDEEEDIHKEMRQVNDSDGEVVEEREKNSLIPIVLFWLGVNILVFSIILIFFSTDGVLYLKWNTKYWFLYSFISIPLIYLGFKGLQNLND
ncbi:MAG: hypothetical protein KR126chlam6_00947 [Candidatus Anoxychlamydiales bacterium]|nr:hypothetical protein [Candidatus Anoxychlamydiales bacterium]